MAGTLFGLPLSQQAGEDGRPLSGGLLYIYEANTSTPAVTYADFNLTSVQTWPLELDAAGRIPSFYVDDGSYRARLTTAGGVEIFDEQAITSIGASSGGTGESVSLDTTTVFQTGDLLWLPVSGTRSGWVRGNGRTIGNGSSGATERANSDTQALFEYFWNNFSDSFCAVGGGRGGSATADFNAAKAIATLDMRAKTPIGLNDMGNSSLGIAGLSTVAATAVGASTNSITVAQANLPNINLSSTGLSATGGVTLNYSDAARGSGGSDAVTAISTGAGGDVTLALAATINVSGTIPLGGSGTAIGFSILSPARVGSYYFKL